LKLGLLIKRTKFFIQNTPNAVIARRSENTAYAEINSKRLLHTTVHSYASRMTRLAALFILLITVLLSSIGGEAGADLQKGLNAHKSGDYATAFQEFQSLAAQGDAEAQYHLAFMYLRGEGTPSEQNCDNGKLSRGDECYIWQQLFLDAAQKGHAGSQLAIAQYILHLGPLKFGWDEPNKEDCELAKSYLKDASKTYHAEANFLMGMYACDLDKKIRFDLIKKSAEEGYDKAFIPIGNLYNYGEGTVTNKKHAYMWYAIALEFGGWSDLRSDVDGLSKEEILEAEKLAQECAAKNYKGC
jgi:TPR repeat protein